MESLVPVFQLRSTLVVSSSRYLPMLQQFSSASLLHWAASPPSPCRSSPHLTRILPGPKHSMSPWLASCYSTLETTWEGSSLEWSSGLNLVRLEASSPFSSPSPGLSSLILSNSSWQNWFSRFVFIPLFLFCNIRPADRGLTFVLFESDVAYIIIMLLFSVRKVLKGLRNIWIFPLTMSPHLYVGYEQE